MNTGLKEGNLSPSNLLALLFGFYAEKTGDPLIKIDKYELMGIVYDFKKKYHGVFDSFSFDDRRFTPYSDTVMIALSNLFIAKDLSASGQNCASYMVRKSLLENYKIGLKHRLNDSNLAKIAEEFSEKLQRKCGSGQSIGTATSIQ